MEAYYKITSISIVIINMLSYALMCFDKYQSKNKGRRIPEINLMLVAFSLGATGVFLGMKAPLFHKVAKAKFKWGIPLLIVFNIVCLYFLF